jgi:hypothetical protein
VKHVFLSPLSGAWHPMTNRPEQAAAAEMLQVGQPKVSALVRTSVVTHGRNARKLPSASGLHYGD